MPKIPLQAYFWGILPGCEVAVLSVCVCVCERACGGLIFRKSVCVVRNYNTVVRDPLVGVC